MYAIIETGGKQYKAKKGRYVDVELLDLEVNKKVTFDKVVMLVNGKKSKVGQPYVEGSTIEGVVTKNDKNKKVIVYKQRPKKGYRKKQGHRQWYSRVMINKIRTKGEKEAAVETIVETKAVETKKEVKETKPKATTTKKTTVKKDTAKKTKVEE